MRSRGIFGFTLVEVIIAMAITGIFALAICAGFMISVSYLVKAFDRVSIEKDAQFFRRRLEYQFRSATNDTASIVGSKTPNDTLRFVSYDDNYYLSNQYTQNEYRIRNGNLIHTCWNSTYNGGTLSPANPYGGSGGTIEVLMANAASLEFKWSGLTVSSSAVTVTVIQRKKMAGGDVYFSTNSFFVRSRNRGI